MESTEGRYGSSGRLEDHRYFAPDIDPCLEMDLRLEVRSSLPYLPSL